MNKSEIEQITLLDLVLHIASCNVGGDHDCGDPACIAPKLFKSYQTKHMKARDRNAFKSIKYGTRIILKSPTRCGLYNQFCKRECPRNNEYQEMEAIN